MCLIKNYDDKVKDKGIEECPENIASSSLMSAAVTFISEWQRQHSNHETDVMLIYDCGLHSEKYVSKYSPINMKAVSKWFFSDKNIL